VLFWVALALPAWRTHCTWERFPGCVPWLTDKVGDRTRVAMPVQYRPYLSMEHRQGGAVQGPPSSVVQKSKAVPDSAKQRAATTSRSAPSTKRRYHSAAPHSTA